MPLPQARVPRLHHPGQVHVPGEARPGETPEDRRLTQGRGCGAGDREVVGGRGGRNGRDCGAGDDLDDGEEVGPELGGLEGVPPRKSLGVALSATSPHRLPPATSRGSGGCGLSAAIAHAIHRFFASGSESYPQLSPRSRCDQEFGDQLKGEDTVS